MTKYYHQGIDANGKPFKEEVPSDRAVLVKPKEERSLHSRKSPQERHEELSARLEERIKNSEEDSDSEKREHQAFA